LPGSVWNSGDKVRLRLRPRGPAGRQGQAPDADDLLERQLAEYSVAPRQLLHAAHDIWAAIAYVTRGDYVATLPDGSALERESIPPSVLKAAVGRPEAGPPTVRGRPVDSLVAGERRPGLDGGAGGSGSSRSSG
jgi:hypothetical protein